MKTKHPNATVAGGSGLTAGGIVIALNRVGVHVPVEVVAVVLPIVPAVALFIGRNGIRGVIDRLWRGSRAPR